MRPRSCCRPARHQLGEAPLGRARVEIRAPAPAQRLGAGDAGLRLPASDGRAAAAISFISRISPLQCSTRSKPASSARLVRSAKPPASAPIEISSDTSTPSKPISPRITLSITLPRQRRRRGVVDRRIDDMRGHRPGHVGQRAERREIAVRQLGGWSSTTRQRLVAVDAGAAVAGDVLDHRQHAAGEQPSQTGAPELARRVPGRCPRRGRRSPDRRRAPADRAPARHRP